MPGERVLRGGVIRFSGGGWVKRSHLSYYTHVFAEVGQRASEGKSQAPLDLYSLLLYIYT